jgi:pimeloyl-ACP methyl ester carboxylesterase
VLRRVIHAYFQSIDGFDLRNYLRQDVPTFIAIEMEDRSAPFYAWTEDFAKNLPDFLPLDEFVQPNSQSVSNMTYYIFDTAHLPFVEDAECFLAETLKFFQKVCPDLMLENNIDDAVSIRSRL